MVWLQVATLAVGLLQTAPSPEIEVLPVRNRPATDLVRAVRAIVGPEGSVTSLDGKLIVRAPPEVMAEVRRAIDNYAPGGAFLPCIPSLETINGHVTPIVIDECNRYGAEWLEKQA